MKRFLLVIIVIFALMQVIQVEKVDYATKKELELIVEPQLKEIFVNACYDCHSNSTNWPWYSSIAPMSWMIHKNVTNGRKALNFSIWESYTQKEKKEHLKDIYRTAYAAMPLPMYIKAHDEANLTKEQRKLIRDWTGVRK